MAGLLCALVLSSLSTDLLAGRPLSWDAVGFVPIEPYAKITPEGRQLLAKLRDGNTEMVAAKSIALIKKDPNDGFAGWLYVQCAKIRRNPTTALAEWDKATPKRTWATEQAAVKLASLRTIAFITDKGNQFFYKRPEPFETAERRARDAAIRFSSSLPVLLTCHDVLSDHIEMRKWVKEFVKRNPSDFYGQLVLGRSLLEGGAYYTTEDGKPVVDAGLPGCPEPKQASVILEQCLQIKPDDPGAQYLAAVARVVNKREDAGFELFATLLKNEKAPLPMVERVRVAYQRRAIESLRRNRDE